MSTSISSGVGDLPCFTTFYLYDPLSNLKFLFFIILVCLLFCTIIITDEPMHTTLERKEWHQANCFHLNTLPTINYRNSEVAVNGLRFIFSYSIMHSVTSEETLGSLQSIGHNIRLGQFPSNVGKPSRGATAN